MPNPTTNDVHVDRPLTNMAISYMQDQDKYLADQIFPYLGVEKQGGKYFKFNKNDLLRNEAEEWVAGTETAGSGYRVNNSASYSATTYGFHKDIGDDVRANADDPLAPDENATRFVTQKLLTQKERKFASKYTPLITNDTPPSIWTTEYDVGSKYTNGWSPGAGGNPLGNIMEDGINAVEGFWEKPNVAVMGVEVYEALIRHSDFTDLYKHTRPGIITKDLLADTLDLDRVFVGRSLYADNTEGGSASTSYCVAPDNLLLLYVPDEPQIDIPSAGYTIGWEGLAGADGRNIVIRNLRIDEKSVDRVEGKTAYDQVQTSADLGALFFDCLDGS